MRNDAAEPVAGAPGSDPGAGRVAGRMALLLDARRARRRGGADLERRRRARLAALVAHARAHSPYYRELYRELPARVDEPARLPITDKWRLMARFDDWVADREAPRERVRAFVDDPAMVGRRFLGRYTVATTSGTTGTRGLFLLDDRSLAVTNALALRMLGDWLAPRDLLAIARRGGRLAMVNATGGHFASAVAAAGLRRGGGWRARRIGVFPAQAPLPELVAGLNRFRPAVVAAYAGVAALLAGEREAGRLRIDPALLVLSAEGLPAAEYGRIARAFGAKVRHSYAATECPFLSYSCAHGWLHVNGDWVVLEPVDAEYRPTPPGEQSHTVLVSNLANRAQPILRYDLGDSVVQRPDPCPCGNPLPAVRVEGRVADTLRFPGADGGQVGLAPLAFGTLLDRVPGVEGWQIVQAAPAHLRLRLRPAAGTDPDRAWRTAEAGLARLLAEHGLGHVAVERAVEPPEQSPGGKYRRIIPLA